jgi:hypothetical protein
MALRDARASYVALLSSVSVGLCGLPCARAGTPSEPGSAALSAARGLFFEALREEQAHKFEDALRDFLRVQSVRDTPAVEYRIASCEEALGRPAAAFASFEAAISLASSDPRAADVAEAARRELDGLATRVARLTLVRGAGVPAAPTPVVELDGRTLAPESLGLPLIVDPGRHVVTAAYGQGPTLRLEIVLAAGESVSRTVPPPSGAGPASSPPDESPAVEAGEDSRVALRRGAFIGWIAGAVLVAGGGVLLWLRSNDIADLDRTCPGGRCPAGADRSALEGTRSRALAEGPWAAVLAGTGILAGGMGTVFAFAANTGAASPRPRAEVVPSFGPTGAGVLVRGVFR